VGHWQVRVPASSANLGPGFDTLAVALSIHLVVSDVGAPADEGHPAVRAFRGAGGEGAVSVVASFPGGRGLGYSGAARVAGLLAAARQRGAHDDPAARGALIRAAAELEGHADNVAASVLGGLVVTAGDRAVRVPLGAAPAVVVWLPDGATSTRESRRALPDSVAFADAVFNVGRTALLVASLAAGDVSAWRAATEDRLHQDLRLEAAPDTRAAIEAALGAGAWCAWLSGSGPAAAAFCDPERASAVAAALPAGGRALVCRIDDEGAVIS
jgi:homoserine kinase